MILNPVIEMNRLSESTREFPVFDLQAQLFYLGEDEDGAETLIGRLSAFYAPSISEDDVDELIDILDSVSQDAYELGYHSTKRGFREYEGFMVGSWLGFDSLEIEEPFRGEKLGYLLMAEVLSMMPPSTLVTCKPFPLKPHGEILSLSEVKALRKYYRTFGFEPHPFYEDYYFLSTERIHPYHEFLYPDDINLSA
jgi:GNAT superfamily N-acetyltransferase